MTGRPRIGVLVGKGVLAEIMDEATAARLEDRFEVAWPAGNGVGPDEAARLIAGASGCVTGWGSPVLNAGLLAGAPALRIVAHAAGTVKPFVTDALWERGIVVTCAAGTIAVDVAQYAVALMVVGRKQVMELAPAAAAGRWGAPAGGRRPGDLRGCTVGVVGASRVGRAVLALLARYDVNALLADPYATPEEAARLGARVAGLDDLFRLSDVVTVHAPALPETRHLVNAARLASMKDGAVLINTARGVLVDEAALVAELKRGRIRAFLDVTDPEPPPAGSPLLGCPHLTLTPHIAGTVGEGRARLGAAAAEELFRYFSGKPPLDAVTRDQLPRLA